MTIRRSSGRPAVATAAGILIGLTLATPTLAGAEQPVDHRPHASHRAASGAAADDATAANRAAAAAIDQELRSLDRLRTTLPEKDRHLVDDLRRQLLARRTELLGRPAPATAAGRLAPAPRRADAPTADGNDPGMPSFRGDTGARRAAIDPLAAPGLEGFAALPGTEEGAANPHRRQQVSVDPETRAWMKDLTLSRVDGRRRGNVRVVRDGFGFRIVEAGPNGRSTTWSPAPATGGATGAAGDGPATLSLHPAETATVPAGTRRSATPAGADATNGVPRVRGRKAPITPRPAPGPGRD